MRYLSGKSYYWWPNGYVAGQDLPCGRTLIGEGARSFSGWETQMWIL